MSWRTEELMLDRMGSDSTIYAPPMSTVIVVIRGTETDMVPSRLSTWSVVRPVVRHAYAQPAPQLLLDRGPITP